MRPFFKADGIELYQGDCREVAPTLGLFESVITDPPYGLSFMGRGWDRGVPGVEFWKIIGERMKPGAMLLAFGGTRTFHRLACAIEDAGWEIRDCIGFAWVYGQGFPKSLDISKAIDKAAGLQRARMRYAPRPESSGTMSGKYDTRPWIEESRVRGYHETADRNAICAAAAAFNGYGSALKPAWEPILLGMKPLDGTFANNAQVHGVAGLNIDRCRIGTEVETWPASRRYYGGSFGQRIIGQGETQKTSMAPSGRFPANLILDGESSRLLDEQSGTLKSGDRNGHRNEPKTKNAFGKFYLRDEHPSHGDSGGASRFFYTAKASRRERGEGNTHPTVKPLSLMAYLCRLTKTPTGGRVLDPFAGSGSTLIAAHMEGREAVGIEMSREYCVIARDRIKAYLRGELRAKPYKKRRLARA